MHFNQQLSLLLHLQGYMPWGWHEMRLMQRPAEALVGGQALRTNMKRPSSVSNPDQPPDRLRMSPYQSARRGSGEAWAALPPAPWGVQ